MSDYVTKKDLKEILKESQAQLFVDLKAYIDGRFQEQDAYLDSKFIDINNRFTEVHKEIDDLAQSTAKAFKHVDGRLDTIERQLDKQAINIDRLEAAQLK